MLGDAEGINEENGLLLKVIEGLQDYLSCEVKFSMDKKRAWLGQPYLIKNLEKKFGHHIINIQSHKVPGTSKFLIVRPMIESEWSPWKMKKVLVGTRYVAVPRKTFQAGYFQHNQGTVKSKQWYKTYGI